MPYLVVCPSCGIRLKSAHPVPAGRSLNCSKCATAFTLSEPAPELDVPSSMNTATTPSKPARVPPPAPVVRSPRLADPDDIPEAEIIDDDPPKAKRRRDPEDDRPRSKPNRRASANLDDDVPRSRQRRDKDEEDERPSRKKSRAEVDDDTDEEDDISPRRRTRKSAKSHKTLVLALASVAAVLFLLCGGGALMYFLNPFGILGGGPPSEMLAWAPANSQSIVYMDVDAARKVDEFNTSARVPGDSAKLGIVSNDIESVMLASQGGGGLFGLMGGDPEVTVIKLKANADQPKIINSAGGKEATVNGKKYYKTQSGGGLYFPSGRIVVATRMESVLMTRLQNDEGKVVITDDLRSASKRADGLMSVVSVGASASQGDIIAMMANAANGFGPGGLRLGGPAGAPSSKATVTVISIKASGSRATLRLESTYDTSESARKIADDLQTAIDQNKNKRTDGETYDISRSGSTVSLTVVGPIKKSGGGMPFGF